MPLLASVAQRRTGNSSRYCPPAQPVVTVVQQPAIQPQFPPWWALPPPRICQADRLVQRTSDTVKPTGFTLWNPRSSPVKADGSSIETLVDAYIEWFAARDENQDAADWEGLENACIQLKTKDTILRGYGQWAILDGSIWVYLRD